MYAWKAACANTGFCYAIGCDGVRAQKLRCTHFRRSGLLPGHDFEERRHAMWVITRIRKCPDTDSVGFVFVAAREVDPLLGRSALGNGHACLEHIRATAGRAQNNRTKHHRRCEQSLALIGMHCTRDVALRDMRNLMCENTGQLVLVARSLNEAGMDADIPARHCKCIDSPVFDDEKFEAVAAIIGLRGDAATNLVDVLVYLGIFEHAAASADIGHDRAAELRFFGFGQNGVGRAAHIRNLDIVGARATRDDQAGQRECQNKLVN